jgi:hypothetical protein
MPRTYDKKERCGRCKLLVYPHEIVMVKIIKEGPYFGLIGYLCHKCCDMVGKSVRKVKRG